MVPRSTMPAFTNTTPRGDPVKQFSVFAENRVGRLYDLATLFSAHDVHIMAITSLDTTDSTLLRMVVDDPDKARELMINNDFFYTECDVLVVELDGQDQFKHVLAALLEVEVNIHYVYSFITRPGDKSAIVLSLEDQEIASQSLAQRNFRVLNQRDISR